ncbi:MAG TPA: hypothetical protein VKF81_11050 [Blastocatellia bacterium]|nr:hypothetical protein [Blastocatellia bacterium]
MKMTFICLLLIGSNFFIAGQDRNQDEKGANSAGQIVERKYNRFNDQTIVKLAKQRILDTQSPRQILEMSIEAMFKGEMPTQLSDTVEIVFTSSAKESPYYGPIELNVIVDGERLKSTKANVGSSYNPQPPIAPDLRVTKDIRAFVDFSSLRKIAGGKKVEIQLGPTELTLDATTLANLSKLASAIFNK